MPAELWEEQTSHGEEAQSEEDSPSLDELFAEAVKPRRRAAVPLRETGAAVYTNPDNWLRTRGVALIHAESQTLLGNFAELVHKSVPGCRRLVRAEGPLAVSTVESVSGDWWLERKPAERRAALDKFHQVDLPSGVSLPDLDVFSSGLQLTVVERYHAIARIELAADTVFGKGEVLILLPAGLDLLALLSREDKIRIRERSGL